MYTYIYIYIYILYTYPCLPFLALYPTIDRMPTKLWIFGGFSGPRDAAMATAGPAATAAMAGTATGVAITTPLGSATNDLGGFEGAWE